MELGTGLGRNWDGTGTRLEQDWDGTWNIGTEPGQELGQN